MSSTTISSVVRNGKEPPRKKKKESPSQVTKPTLSISLLPYDLLLNCLARVSILYHPTLSLVSKKFRSIVASKDLYKTRSLLDLNEAESCIYLCLRFPCDSNTYWYTLYHNTSGNRLVEIPYPYTPTAQWSNWIEVFDQKTQTWESVTNPGRKIREELVLGRLVLDRELKSLGIDGEVDLFGDDECMVYEGRWNPKGMDSEKRLSVGDSYGYVNDVLFKWYDGLLKWYDDKVDLWKNLKGVKDLPDFRHRRFCKIMDLGGKMVVLWDEHHVYSNGYLETNIWCAEIALDYHEYDIWGNVEWFDVVLTVDNSCGLWDADAISAIIQ